MIFPLVELFLSDYSEKAAKYGFKRLNDFKTFLESLGVENIENIEKIHLTRFGREFVNNLNMLGKTKSKYFGIAKKYLKFLSDNDIIKNSLDVSPPRWTDWIDPDKPQENKINPSEEDIIKLLKHSFRVNPRMFIYIALMAHNGMRDSECRSIRLHNIDLENRTIISGVIENHAKKGICYYYIPDKLVPHLKRYIDDLKTEFNNPVSLFHSKGETDDFLSKRSIDRNLVKYKEVLKLNCAVNTHVFRHSLNWFRFTKKCDNALMAILLNQKPEGTNAKFYLKQLKENPGIRYDWWKEYTWDLISV